LARIGITAEEEKKREKKTRGERDKRKKKIQEKKRDKRERDQKETNQGSALAKLKRDAKRSSTQKLRCHEILKIEDSTKNENKKNSS
jgi:hypothetical protein